MNSSESELQQKRRIEVVTAAHCSDADRQLIGSRAQHPQVNHTVAVMNTKFNQPKEQDQVKMMFIIIPFLFVMFIVH